MCITAGPVKNISGTKIFCSIDGDRQLVAYQMNVDTPTGNALILPIPANAHEVELLDWSSSYVLAQLEEEFAEQMRGMTRSFGVANSYLKVVEVGDYKVSIAPTAEDIRRADPAVFKLSPTTAQVLAQHYKRGYCFVVATLKASGKLSPLAFSFPKLVTGNYFVPTRHEHGHPNDEFRPSWDHKIYLRTDKPTGSFIYDTSTGTIYGEVRQRSLASHHILNHDPTASGWIGGGDSVVQLRIYGTQPNGDLWV